MLTTTASSTGFAAPLVRVLVDYLSIQGHDTHQVLQSLGVSDEQLDDMSLRVPSAHLAKSLHVVCKMCGDDNASIRIAQMLRPAHLGNLGYALISSPNVLDALTLFDRMQQLLCNEMLVERLLKPNSLELRCTLLPSMPRDTQLWSFIASARLSFSRWAMGRHLVPIRMALPCPAPIRSDLLLSHLGCPVQFDAPQALEEMPLDWLDLHNPNADPHMHKMMTSMAVHSLNTNSSSSDDIVSRVSLLIQKHLKNGELPLLEALLPELAATGCHSSRQLQRRLAQKQLSYSALVENLRKEQALNDLQFTDLPLSEVAHRAAYAELASFHRAVKRWTGTSPLAWRQQQKKTPQP
jgi:AraC-like DNA-binding protein